MTLINGFKLAFNWHFYSIEAKRFIGTARMLANIYSVSVR